MDELLEGDRCARGTVRGSEVTLILAALTRKCVTPSSERESLMEKRGEQMSVKRDLRTRRTAGQKGGDLLPFCSSASVFVRRSSQ